MFIFHALILLTKKSEEDAGKKAEYKDHFYKLIKLENRLPPEFCLEILLKYVMLDEALHLLFYREHYSELLSLIHAQFDKLKQQSKKIKEKL